MHRAGLFIALAVAALVGVTFGLYPELDVMLAGRFFDLGKNSFELRFDPWLMGLREAAMWLVTAIVVPFVIALIVKLVRPRMRWAPGRAVVFLLVSLALGPGLTVNTLLKDQWGRPRPIDIPAFGGSEPFMPWWDPRGDCPKNCSFVAGDASGAFWTVAPAALAPPAWRPAAYAAAVAFGISSATWCSPAW
jgi:lipid A 4'-phosphatase